MKRLLNIQLSPACGLIAGGIAVNCTPKLVGGANDRLILINFDDIASLTPDVGNPNLYTAITLAATKVAYVFEGKQQSVEPSHALVKTRYSIGHDHIVQFKAFNNSPSVKVVLDAMVEGRFLAIIENNFKGTSGNAAFELYGVDAGLYVEVMERNVADSETLGAYNIQLKSGEFGKEGHVPSSLWDTDYVTTKALVDALL